MAKHLLIERTIH